MQNAANEQEHRPNTNRLHPCLTRGPRLFHASALPLASIVQCVLLLFVVAHAYQSIAEPAADPISREHLFAPAKEIDFQIKHLSPALDHRPSGQGGWTIRGEIQGSATAILTPVKSNWDLSAYSLFSVTVRNDGSGTVWLDGRLDNPGAADWANSSRSQLYLLPGEEGTLTIAFPRRWESDDSPDQFEPASAKPNGWRSHWKSFDSTNVKSCRLIIRSSNDEVKLNDLSIHLAWPYGKDANQRLLALPFVDRFGQAIPLSWDHKISSVTDLRRLSQAETRRLEKSPRVHGFNKYGGYASGPQLEATGFFRTQKVNGKWWLVDPEGRLFWSHGVCTVGNTAISPLSPERRKLFAYLPEPGTDEHKIAIVPYKPYGEWGRAVDFLRLNTMRKHGDGWQDISRDITHRRLQAWGFNTLGAWSDTALLDDRRTPYTEILHIWPGQQAFEHTADPFEEGFEKRVNDAVATLARERGNDPWMIGVFIDNEIVWHNNLPERVLKAGPRQPAYSALIKSLRAKYHSIGALNKAWNTNAQGWGDVSAGKGEAWQNDRTGLYALVADRYYRVCKQAVRRHLPNHLYLGSRVHTCPPIVARKIAQHTDVFSVNHYASLAGTAQLPKDADMPVMITEFHFGTSDRGVIGMSLSPVHDQVQRSRSYGAYITAGLLHQNIVGAHWFAYSDQSTVGRPNENYQIGLIDITDQPYEEMIEMSRSIAERMYQLRDQSEADTLTEVHQIFTDLQRRP